jgi:hypothetical protein
MNIINNDVNNKIDNFYKSYRELMEGDFKNELKKCEKLNESKLSVEEEDYYLKVVGLCENMIDSLKIDCNYWGLKK